MNIERHLFRTRRPVLVAETIDVFAVVLRVEGVVAGGNASVVDDEGVRWVKDLPSIVSRINLL